MDVVAIVFVLVGLVLLVGGGDVLVRGAAGIAERLGTPPLVIGLTVVALGTSAPELAVTVQAAMTGAADVALGNVVGSNLFNVLVVLGITALVGGLHVDRVLLKLEAPLLVVVTGFVLVAARDGLAQWEGGVLLVGAVLFLLLVVARARRSAPQGVDPDPLEAPAGDRAAWQDVGLVVVGLGLLTGGANLLVSGAIDLAAGLGVSDVVIGLTVVAAGTSLPELATSVVAAARGQRDIAVGNVLGSNLLNLLVVLGFGVTLTAGGLTVDPLVVDQDLPVLLLVQVLLVPLLFLRAAVGRLEGFLLLAGFGGYLLLVLLPRVV